MYLLAPVLALLASVQPLSRKDLKGFDNAFELMRTAHSKGRADIVAKYGPEVLANYDLIQIQFEPGDDRRDAYDSLNSWVYDAKLRLRVVDQAATLPSLPPSALAAELAQLETSIANVQDSTLRVRTLDQALESARTAYGSTCSLDTLFRVQKLLPPRYRVALAIDKRVADGLDLEYRQAFNQGADALARFDDRFPGVRTAEIQGAIAFAQVDETNALLRSKSKEGLLKLYKGMQPGRPRSEVAAKLEKILYDEWAGARIHDAEIRAAKDFLEIFREEPKKSAKYKEIESWLFYNNAGPAPVVLPAGDPSLSAGQLAGSAVPEGAAMPFPGRGTP